jgi:hypothetical protein
MVISPKGPRQVTIPEAFCGDNKLNNVNVNAPQARMSSCFFMHSVEMRTFTLSFMSDKTTKLLQPRINKLKHFLDGIFSTNKT